jgi:hypothetical protein
MLNVFMVITILTLLAILGVLIDIAVNLRAGCKKLNQYINSLFLVKRADPHHGQGGKPRAAFSIWCFENGSWTLLCPCGQVGCPCGPAPAHAGSYEGQVVRKECPEK